MNLRSTLFIGILVFVSVYQVLSQDLNQAKISGNFQMDARLYNTDTIIGAPPVAEKLLSNSFLNINYYNGNLSAGFRYEAYINTLTGYNKKNDGSGFPYYYVNYKKDELEITAGCFYEQFGNGLSLRTYEDWGLGYDNNLRGIRLKYNLFKGIYLTGLMGKQRLYFEQGPGIVRGFDGEVFLNDLIKSFSEKPFQISFGGSFVSKFQRDIDPLYNLPENVGTIAGRFNLIYKNFQLSGEYANKINDPSVDNNYIYKNGNALVINAGYSNNGLGIMLAVKRFDNMSFRSDRNASLNDLNINYLPPNSRNLTYRLPAMYPYGTQTNGEVGLQADIMYNIKKGTLLGGKYGTNLRFNFSRINNIDKQVINDSIAIGQNGTMGYNSRFYRINDEIYFQDINFEIEKRINKKLKTILMYQNLIYNKAVIEGKGGMIYANVLVADISIRIKPRNTIRFEIQNLSTDQDKGDWFMGLIEYSISPKWFFSISDQYNYGNEEKDQQLHYINGSVTYVKNATRIQVGYGRQREGIYCTGGVCRFVPALNGFSISITSRF